MAKLTLTYAPDAWKCLNGFFCVYKASGISYQRTSRSVIEKLIYGLNSMETRPPRDFVRFAPLKNVEEPVEMKVTPNYADHPLVVGPRYQMKDIKMEPLNKPGVFTSGVTAFAIGDSCPKAELYNACNYVSTYRISGQFGIACLELVTTSKVMHKAKYDHITTSRLERALSTLQNAYQGVAFTASGINLKSQLAYNLASTGLVRPLDARAGMMIYGLKLIDYDPPHFTLELHCTQDNETELLYMIHSLGVRLKSCAAVSKMRLIRHGHFGLDHALLKKHWDLQSVIENIILCREVENDENLDQRSPHLVHVTEASKTHKLLVEEEEAEIDPSDAHEVNEASMDIGETHLDDDNDLEADPFIMNEDEMEMIRIMESYHADPNPPSST